MGFNKKYVPEYEVLVKEILTVDSDILIKRYVVADALIGPADSINLLNEYMKEYYEGDYESTQGFIKELEKSNQ